MREKFRSFRLSIVMFCDNRQNVTSCVFFLSLNILFLLLLYKKGEYRNACRTKSLSCSSWGNGRKH